MRRQALPSYIFCMVDVDVVVIGGGISGMSLAHFCAAAGLEVLVVERALSLGGCLASWRPTDDYWVELGTHTCYNSYTTLLELLRQLGQTGEIMARARVPFRLLVDGRVRPVQKELSFSEILWRLPRLLCRSKRGKTVRGYYEPLVGPHNYARVFRALFAGVLLQPADDLPAESLFKTRRRRQKSVPRSFTFRRGVSSVVEAMARQPRLQVRTGAAATRVVRDARGQGQGDGSGHRQGLVVELADGTSVTGRFVALAVPPDAAAKITASQFPAVATLLGGIATRSVTTTGLVIEKTASPVPPVAGIIPVAGGFYSIVSRDTVPDARYRGFALHAASGVADGLALATAALGIASASVLHTTCREVVLPAPRLGHDRVVAELDTVLAGLPLLVTGNFFLGLAIEDCVIRSLAEGRRLLGMREVA